MPPGGSESEGIQEIMRKSPREGGETLPVCLFPWPFQTDGLMKLA